MAVGKEIRNQIKSIKNTQKITSAMEMVAASKMRKAQDRMLLGKPYAINIRNVVSHLANANPEYHHVYMKERSVKRVGFVVVSSDRGLCGGLNINVFKAMIATMKSWHEQGAEADICTIGAKAASSRYWASASRIPPPSLLMILDCAAPPTRDTDSPAFMAGRIPELNKLVSRNI